MISNDTYSFFISGVSFEIVAVSKREGKKASIGILMVVVATTFPKDMLVQEKKDKINEHSKSISTKRGNDSYNTLKINKILVNECFSLKLTKSLITHVLLFLDQVL